MQGQDPIATCAISTSNKVGLGRCGWETWIPAELRGQPRADNFALTRLLGLGRSIILSMKGTLLLKLLVPTERNNSGFKQQFQRNLEDSIVDHKYVSILLHPAFGDNLFVKMGLFRFGGIKIKQLDK